MATRIIAVFDFDLTLTRWDSAGRFFRWLLRRNLLRIGAVAATAPLLAPLLLSRRARRVPIRFAVWVSTFGISHERMAELAAEHVAAVHAGGERFVLADARRCLAAHLDEGHTVVIATGALDVLVEAVLAAEGIVGVDLVASSTRPWLGGMVTKQHCYAQAKIPMLAERGYPAPFDHVYSDHEVDLPLFAAGRTRHLVNPRPQAVERVGARLGATPTVLRWT